MRRSAILLLATVFFSMVPHPTRASAEQPSSLRTATKKQRKTSPSQDEMELRTRLELDPHDSEAHEALHRLLGKRYAFRAEAVELHEWIKNNPSDYHALIELNAAATAALHDPEFAIAEQRAFLKRARREENDTYFDLAMSRLADELSGRGHFGEALDYLDELIKNNPADSGLQAERAALLAKIGQLGNALDIFRRALEADPSSVWTHRSYADTLALAGDFEEAASEYRAALSLYDQKYIQGGTTNAAEQLTAALAKVSQENKSNHALADLHLRLARALQKDEKWTEAVAETRAAFEADSTDLKPFYVRAQIYDSKGDTAAAAAARADAKILADKWKQQAAAEMKGKKRKDDFNIDDVDLRLAAVSSQFSEEDDGMPTEVIGILEPRKSLSSFERLIFAHALVDVGRIPEGCAQYELAVEKTKQIDNAITRAEFGQRLLRRGAPERAVPHLRRAYELDPQNLTYRLDYEQARRSVKSSPDV